MQEGVIKFQLHWEPDNAPAHPCLQELVTCRNRLRKAGLIGVDRQGLGYGNISLRAETGFIISGSQTGAVEQAGPEHFTQVTAWDIGANRVWCRGPVKASSESLTHAMFYELDAGIRAVVHVHHHRLWQARKGRWPVTPASVSYGTAAMAEAVRDLWQHGAFRSIQALVMGGHEAGIMAFGRDPETVCRLLVKEAAGLNG